MNILVLLASLLIMVSSEVLGQETPFGRFYAGTEAVATQLTDTDGEVIDTTGIAGFLGASWSRDRLYAAVEAEVSVGIAAQGSGRNDRSQGASLSVLAGIQPRAGTVLFGRIGYQRARLDGQADPSRGGAVSATALRLGFGADHALDTRFRLRAELGRSFADIANARTLERTQLRVALIHQF